MKVTLNWLKRYVDFDWSSEELSERLTMLGLEVESVRKLGGDFEGIIVAQVLTCEKHPNADKLSLCRVNDGTGERQIVCGARNFKPGDKVPLILPGASLPLKPGEKTPFTIKVGKIRGVESHGMMCSPQELGLPDPVDGLLILREDARVGQPFAEYLGRPGNDVVFDLEVTPNRPDLNSVLGIAREIAALTGGLLNVPEVSVASGPASVVGSEAHALMDEWLAVRCEEPELCPRYTARLIHGVKIGPSPDWLKSALEKVGVRSINNVVDVTNFVMIECGQPLHAFDYHLLAKGTAGRPAVVVRRATGSETFTTLDGREHPLNGEALLIADETRGIALAGVMGGLNTGIQETTRDVLIESACFQPRNIRRTSRRLGLRTESSHRFERGADIGITDWASRRCAQLILETAGGELVPGSIDVCPRPGAAMEITLRHPRTDSLLGVGIPIDQQIEWLRRLGLEVAVGPGIAPATGVRLPLATTFRIPTWRVDLKREVDLIEEVARLHGVDRIPGTPPRGAVGTNAFDSTYDRLTEVRQILTGLGLNEAQGQTLVSLDPSAQMSGTLDAAIPLANPLSSDMDVLRPSLLPGLLDVLRHNAGRQNHELALFEIGRVFVREGDQAREERRVAMVLTGRRHWPFWDGVGSHIPVDHLRSLKSVMEIGSFDERTVKTDIFDLKGVVEELLERLGVGGVSYQTGEGAGGSLVEKGLVLLPGGRELGFIGQLSPSQAVERDLSSPVFLAELSLDPLLAGRRAEKSFKPLPQFPSIRRDVAMLVDEGIGHDGVLAVVRKARPANLVSAQLFDVMGEGILAGIPPGQKSMAFAFTYRHSERTLTDEEVNGTHARLVEALKLGLKATIR